jgi:hypothetical protein
MYIALIAGYQIGILWGALLIEMKTSFIKQNINFKKSKELKGQSKKFKKQVATLS